jgi:hypothetical protein
MRDSTVESWVRQLMEAYPDAPDSLTTDHEKKNLDRLEGWFDRLEEIRSAWDEIDTDELDLPESFDQIGGGRQVIPVLMTIEDFSPEEKRAWHNLFVPVSAMMAKIAHGYWQSHGGTQTSLSLEDMLDYLPIVFLYVLSSYDPDRKTEEYEDDFSDDVNRIRLTTWVHRDTRRHIRSYLQQHLYIVDRGSGYIHRLRHRIHQIRGEKYADDGEEPTREEIVDELKSTSEGEDTSRGQLEKHVNRLTGDETVASMDEPVSGSSGSDNDLTHGDLMTTGAQNVERFYQPLEYLMERTDEIEPLRSACEKIATTGEPLTFRERRYLDL